MRIGAMINFSLNAFTNSVSLQTFVPLMLFHFLFNFLFNYFLLNSLSIFIKPKRTGYSESMKRWKDKTMRKSEGGKRFVQMKKFFCPMPKISNNAKETKIWWQQSRDLLLCTYVISAQNQMLICHNFPTYSDFTAIVSTVVVSWGHRVKNVLTPWQKSTKSISDCKYGSAVPTSLLLFKQKHFM